MNIIEGIPPSMSGMVAIDLEISGLRPGAIHRPEGSFRLATFSNGRDTWVVKTELGLAKALDRLDKAVWVFHNAPFDLRQIRRWVDVDPRPIHDTYLVERLLWNGLYERFGLDDVVRRDFGVQLDKSIREQFISGAPMTQKMIAYAARDAYYTQRIAFEKHRPILEEDSLSEKCWREIDMPCVWAILDLQGIYIDQDAWRRLAIDNQKKATSIMRSLKFNPGSWQQVLDALSKKKLLLPNTREETLAEYAGDPLVDKILEYRGLAKGASTYGLNWLAAHVESDGRVYTALNINGAETSRWASSNPNLQNIPIDLRYRACFIAPSGRIVDADYSSIEPRTLAHYSQDIAMMEVFESGENIHLVNARTALNRPNLTKKNKEEYTFGKSMNLASGYGMSAQGLATKAHIPLEDAELGMRGYFDKYWGVARWISKVRDEAEEVGYIRTLGGHWCWMKPYNKRLMKNAPINYPNQGSAADVLKLAIARIHKRLGRRNFPMIVPVHDELIFEIDTKKAGALAKMVKEEMLAAFKDLVPDVPGSVDVVIGRSWADKE